MLLSKFEVQKKPGDPPKSSWPFCQGLALYRSRNLLFAHNFLSMFITKISSRLSFIYLRAYLARNLNKCICASISVLLWNLPSTSASLNLNLIRTPYTFQRNDIQVPRNAISSFKIKIHFAISVSIPRAPVAIEIVTKDTEKHTQEIVSTY